MPFHFGKASYATAFNTEKCEAIQLSLKPAIPNSYTLYGKHLKGVTEAKYLGVTIDCKLSFNKHIDIVRMYESKLYVSIYSMEP